jgi:hypothetical protein
MGIHDIRSRPHHPQIVGKIAAFWKNIRKELLSEIPISRFKDAKRHISGYINK